MGKHNVEMDMVGDKSTINRFGLKNVTIKYVNSIRFKVLRNHVWNKRGN